MAFPTRLKIGGHTIKVVLKDEWDDSADSDGKWVSEKNEIWVKAGLPDSQRAVTLLHEILHAVNSELEHPVIESLAQQLFQVLKDNHLTWQ